MEAIEALGINPGYLIGYSAGVLLMVLILARAAVNPIREMLQARRERIAEGSNNARKAEENLANAEAERQQILEEARSEAQQIITEARQRAEETAKQLVANAEQDAQQTREQALAEADQRRDDALSDVRGQIIDLAIAAANHLVGGLDESRQRELAAAFFSEIPEEARDFTGNVVVITAVPLTDSEKDSARSTLANAENITFRVDPGILGGVIVRAGAREVDNSFQAQLTSMRSQMA
ncbi:MAG: F0F1 ATP synthase subunit B [Anaerolineae bacterium]